MHEDGGIWLRPLGHQAAYLTGGGIRRRGGEAAIGAPATDRATARPDSGPSLLAVLALANLSGDPANDHLCEGIVEDVIQNLSASAASG